jgi:hypothetical protein
VDWAINDYVHIVITQVLSVRFLGPKQSFVSWPHQSRQLIQRGSAGLVAIRYWRFQRRSSRLWRPANGGLKPLVLKQGMSVKAVALPYMRIRFLAPSRVSTITHSHFLAGADTNRLSKKTLKWANTQPSGLRRKNEPLQFLLSQQLRIQKIQIN